MKSIAVIGGDLRYLYSEKYFLQNAYKFNYYNDLQKLMSPDFIENDIYVMPLPLTKDGINIYTPLIKDKINLDNQIFKQLKNKIIFTNKNIFDESNMILDYSKNEYFLEENSRLTAEATVDLIKNKYNVDIENRKILIVGNGNLTKACCNEFINFTKEISVSTRKINSKIKEKIGDINYTNINFDPDIQKYDIIINTVPNMIIKTTILDKMNKNTLIIDLASKPGGVDYEYAKKINIKAVNELGLPGKYYPMESGKIMVETIILMLGEV